MTTDERFAVLSALIDREPVDADLLAVALEDVDGRAQLVDFVRLRARVATECAVDDGAGPPASVRARTSVRTWVIRAALVLLPLTLGAIGGAWFVERQQMRPPTPTRVVQFAPGVDWK